MMPPAKRTCAPRKPRVDAAAAPETHDQQPPALSVVDGAFLASLTGTLKTIRKKTRDDKISSLPIA